MKPEGFQLGDKHRYEGRILLPQVEPDVIGGKSKWPSLGMGGLALECVSSVKVGHFDRFWNVHSMVQVPAPGCRDCISSCACSLAVPACSVCWRSSCYVSRTSVTPRLGLPSMRGLIDREALGEAMALRAAEFPFNVMVGHNFVTFPLNP